MSIPGIALPGLNGQSGAQYPPLAVDTTITVHQTPGVGQYTSINAALVELSRTPPEYIANGYTAEISLLSGFVMAEQVLVSGLDLSWVTITSIDATVAITRSALTLANSLGVYPAFSGYNAKLPTISVLFQMDSSGPSTNRYGITLDHSEIAVTSGDGIQAAATSGILVINASNAKLTGANFASAVYAGIHAFKGSRVEASSCVVTNCSTNGIRCEEASTVNAKTANATGSGTGFAVFFGSIIEANGATGTLSQAANTPTANGVIFQ